LGGANETIAIHGVDAYDGGAFGERNDLGVSPQHPFL
jgi:hypothetical protein